MKTLFLSGLLLMLFSGFMSDPQLSQVRSLYSKAPAEEKHCEALLELLKNVDLKTQHTLAGYKGCATMIMAKHVFNPFSKMSYFRKGKTLLENAIAADTANIELRVLRLGVQINTPAFLGYKGKIATDKAFLERKKAGVRDEYLRGMIKTVL